MRALDRKLTRDLWRQRWQVLSIALVVAAGIATVVVFRSAFDSLEASRDAYYREARFADAWASLQRAPEPLARRIAAISGVSGVDTRVVREVVLDVPGLPEPATGRLVSLPADDRVGLNRLHVRAGLMPIRGRGHEALVSEVFARENGLRLGDTLGAVINGRWERLVVTGVALSPEYVYAAPSGGFLTDNRRFGVLWVERDVLAAAYGMAGAFNSVALALSPGASRPAVLAELDRVLEPYGGLGAYDRSQQTSNRVIADEMRQNRRMGTLIPGLILGVAAFLLSVVLGRMVDTEREEIAVLKAFGYRDLDVGRHYLRFALAAVALGAAIGIGAGLWLGRGMLGLYAEVFRFPELRYQASWVLVLGAVAASAAAAVAGALGAVRRTVRLAPAAAMQPESPAGFARGLVERLLPPRSLTPSARIVVRNLSRRPLRTGIAVLGVGLAMSLLVLLLFFFASFFHSMDLQFRVAQRQDVTVLFNAPRAAGVRHDLAAVPGVARGELLRGVAVRLRNGHRMRQLALQGVETDAALARVMDGRGRRRTVPAGGVLLSAELARALEVAPGDTVVAEVLEGARPVLRVPITGTVDDLFGLNAYVEHATLARLLGETPTATGAHLALDGPAAEAAVNGRLERMPLVAGVSSPRAMLASFESEMGRNLRTNLLITAIFAGVIAVGVVYNGARTGLSERGRELATLRVLGFTRHETAVILLGEQAVVTALAVPLGWLMGIGYSLVWLQALNGEVYRLPVVFRASTFIWAAGMTFLAAALAGLAVRRRLGRLDLIAVLKTRE